MRRIRFNELDDMVVETQGIGVEIVAFGEMLLTKEQAEEARKHGWAICDPIYVVNAEVPLYKVSKYIVTDAHDKVVSISDIQGE